MDKYDPEKLRTDFVNPLAKLASDLTTIAKDLENAYKSGNAKRDYLPLNDGGDTKGPLFYLKQLQHWVEFEVQRKLDMAKKGALAYREKELKFRSERKPD